MVEAGLLVKRILLFLCSLIPLMRASILCTLIEASAWPHGVFLSDYHCSMYSRSRSDGFQPYRGQGEGLREQLQFSCNY